MPDSKDSLLGFVRSGTTASGDPIVSQAERDIGITQGMKNMMGGQFRGFLPPIQPEAIYKGMQTDPTGGPSFPLFNVVKEGHPLNGSTVSAQTLVENGLSAHVPDIQDKIKAMTAAGASTEEMENAISEIQNVHSELAQANRMAWGAALKNGLGRILSSGFSGAVMPPFLDQIIQKGMSERYEQKGGA